MEYSFLESILMINKEKNSFEFADAYYIIKMFVNVTKWATKSLVIVLKIAQTNRLNKPSEVWLVLIKSSCCLMDGIFPDTILDQED